MKPTCANDYIEHHTDDHEVGGTGFQRMKRKTHSRRGKYAKTKHPVRRGIKERSVRRIMW